jgi:hypothetical protein
MNRVVVGLLGVALLFGVKFFNKSSDSRAVKARLLELCESDTRCVQSVEAHFDACFESSYKLGGRRKASHLEAGQMVQCLNSRSGQSYFASAK